MKHLLMVLVISLFALPNLAIHAQDTCELGWYTNNSRLRGSQVNLYSRETDEIIRAVDDGIENFYRFQIHDISPDCKYVVTSITRRFHPGSVSTFGHLYLLDAITGATIAIFPDEYRHGPNPVEWSPDSQRILVESQNGTYLWDFLNDAHVQLTTDNINNRRVHTIWDNNTLFLMSIMWSHGKTTSHTVQAFDAHSGTLIANYENDIAGLDVHFVSDLSFYDVLPNAVIAYRLGSDSLNQNAPVSVWNRYTHEKIAQVNAGTAGVMGIRFRADESRNLIDLSPDLRYLAIGFRTVRVWDLWSLPENYIDRTATYQYNIDNLGIDDLQFVDNTTIQITLDNNRDTIWIDVVTGEQKTLPNS